MKTKLIISLFALAVFIVLQLSESAYSYTWGDTLTVIQRPLLNIPALVEPEGVFQAWLKSPETEDDWQGELLLNGLSFPLDKVTQTYNTAFAYWQVYFQTMLDMPLELYDFRVYNSEGEWDISQHAVSVDWEQQGNYQFAVICDSHLPTVEYWTNPEPDSSVIPDVLAVYEDLAIIHPRFILHLGDLVDQGYLEEYQNRHQMGRAQEVLAQSPAPIFLIAGNHDVGGCDSPNFPFPAGCARQYWWKYYGWSWLENPPDDHYTQDYTFGYGGDLFIGMEAYQLYDHWREQIYNYLSFCPTAMAWLNNALSVSGYNNRILFTHWDYSRQIDPAAFDLDMVLYGHVHINYGSLTQQPYVLSLENVYEHFKSLYGRAYMLVSVVNGELHPRPVLYAGHNGEKLTLDYYPDNSGTHPNVSAVISNANSQSISNALIKINYPLNVEQFEVQNGELVQTINYDINRTLYIRCDIPAEGEQIITVISSMQAGVRAAQPGNLAMLNCHPMPFNASAIFYFELNSSAFIELNLYTITGKLAAKIASGSFPAGKSVVRFKNTTLPSGIYFARLQTGKEILIQKVIILR